MTVQGAHQDELHVPGDENPWFTETAWYAFWDPAGRYMGHVYMRFRPNTGVADCNLYIWTSGVSLPWDTAYWKCFAMAYPESIRDLKFVGGLTHRVESDFAKYRITYEDTTSPLGGAHLDLTLESVGRPKFFGRKHFDQAMHATGKLRIGDDQVEIDSLCMRDRSWYTRSDFGNFHSGYSYYLTEDTKILVLSAFPPGTDQVVPVLPVVGGYVNRGGTELAVVGGWRKVESRDAASGAPDRLSLEVLLADGEEIHLSGRSRNTIAISCNTAMFSWMCLVDWDTEQGPVMGEDQEIWSPSLWRAFRHGDVRSERLGTASSAS
jgi:hypothetical protein